MSEDIQRADPAYRRRTLRLLGIAVVLAIVVLVCAQRWMQAHAIVGSPREAAMQIRQWIGITATLCGFCLLALAGHAGWLSSRARREARWPLAAARVMRDTRVRRGEGVAPIIRWLRITTLVLVALAALAIVVGWQIRSVPV